MTKTVRKRPGKPVQRTTTVRVRENPHARQFALIAKGPRRKALRFTGIKFADHERPVMFASMAQVRTAATQLRRRFGRVLRNYSLYAEPARAGKR